MTIKVKRADSDCEPTFEPYSICITVNNEDDHRALKYLSMNNMKVPHRLEDAANASLKIAVRKYAVDIRERTQAFLIALGRAIPSRSEVFK